MLRHESRWKSHYQAAKIYESYKPHNIGQSQILINALVESKFDFDRLMNDEENLWKALFST